MCLLFNCKSQNIIKQNKAKFYLDKTIEIFEQKKRKINPSSDFIFLSSMKFNDTILKDAKYSIGISIMSSNLTSNLKYKHIYKYKNFKVVSKDTLNIFKSLLLSAPYENMNKNNKKGVTYDPFNISLFVDEKGNIIYVSPDIYESDYKK